MKDGLLPGDRDGAVAPARVRSMKHMAAASAMFLV